MFFLTKIRIAQACGLRLQSSSQGLRCGGGCGGQHRGIDPILVGIGEFTAHFGTCFGGWIESDVHWGERFGF